MGWNDPFDSELSNLPPEAWGNVFDTDGPFNPSDSWISTATKDNQLLAMREWFCARYCDPVLETPYNGREGGYLFIYGGPYRPYTELLDRFGDVVNGDLITELAEELVREAGDQWAPVRQIDPSDEYDERFDLEPVDPEVPLLHLRTRIEELTTTLSLQTDARAKALVSRLVFSALIGVLEAFLWETAQHWIEEREDVLRRCIEKIPVFRDQPMKLGEVFERHGKIREIVKGHLQNMVWHRWDQVGILYKSGLGVPLPSTKALREALVIRHHIVHRSGTDMEGQLITINDSEVRDLADAVEAFAKSLASACLEKFGTTDF